MIPNELAACVPQMCSSSEISAVWRKETGVIENLQFVYKEHQPKASQSNSTVLREANRQVAKRHHANFPGFVLWQSSSSSAVQSLLDKLEQRCPFVLP